MLSSLMGIATIVLILAAAAGKADKADKPDVELRATPRMQTVNLGQGCSVVRLVLEITGPESEEWYCPQVEWTCPDDTRSREQSDCPPFEQRYACLEPQEACGLRGWFRHPTTGAIVDKVKDCPCTIIGYPRRWHEAICLPSNPIYWTLRATLRWQKRYVDRAVEVYVY